VIDTDALVDQRNRKFDIEKKLKSSGLPIYVFEQSDTEQILKEESDEVKQAYASEASEREALQQENTDVQSD